MITTKSFYKILPSPLSIGEGLRVRFVLMAILFNVTTNFSFAQTYSLSPNDTVYKIGIMEDLETLNIEQTNISPNTITLKWKKLSASVPPLWDASICDNSICNTTLVDSGKMNPVIPTTYGLLLVHITPHTNLGTAIIKYAVWDSANASLKDTLTYILTVNTFLGFAETENKNTFSIYPNPANENININFTDYKTHSISISNAVGEIIYKKENSSNCTLPIQNWSNGVYTVSILTNKKIIHSKKIIVQH
jgi:hypothetical protein